MYYESICMDRAEICEDFDTYLKLRQDLYILKFGEKFCSF